MKKSELIFSAILVPVDFLMIFLATLVAYFIRFESFYREIRPVVYEIPLAEYLNISWMVSLVCLVIFALAGLYTMKGTRRLFQELSKIFLACSTAVMIVIVLIFFKRELFSSRFIVLVAWFFSLIFVSLGRMILHYIQHLLFKKGLGKRRVVVIGVGRTAENIMHEFKFWPTLGYEVKEQFKNFKEESKVRLEELVKKNQVEEIFLLNANLNAEETLSLKDYCDEKHLGFNYSTDLFGTEITNFAINTIAGVPIVEVKRTSLDGWGKIIKRIFDILGSLALIILTAPIMIITALAIKIDSKGPIFFYQLDDGSPAHRVGQYGQLFRHFKFRSMKPGTHNWRYEKLADLNFRKDGPMVKIKDDPRLTRVGRIIRKLSLDELPEFFLVLAGKMSLVGPRPHLPEEVANYQKHHKKVLTIKPGITGLAQISGRSDLAFEEEVRLDTYYIEHWSIWLDILIILKTPWVVLSRKSAQ